MSHRQNGIPLFNVTLTQKKALYLNRHIINTLTNVTRTNVTQTNCHLDKILPFRCHNQVSSVTSIFSSGQMSPGQMSLGQMSPGQILPCQPCSTAQLDHQKHLFPLVPSSGAECGNAIYMITLFVYEDEYLCLWCDSCIVAARPWKCATDRGSSAVGYTVPACPGSKQAHSKQHRYYTDIDTLNAEIIYNDSFLLT